MTTIKYSLAHTHEGNTRTHVLVFPSYLYPQHKGRQGVASANLLSFLAKFVRESLAVVPLSRDMLWCSSTPQPLQKVDTAA